ncbi:hypothetical protein CMV_017436 [Castanea mollissima]|uniref:Large ribosomal subunit protein uL11 C-terminal domain-containing protein n=1 Tax=Castanea mollissima TaxID=60419 RepID=A0A8J4VQN6_9ROSI|nr:hypothetical protein CMV_017436 [Castanea mollissima]
MANSTPLSQHYSGSFQFQQNKFYPNYSFSFSFRLNLSYLLPLNRSVVKLIVQNREAKVSVVPSAAALVIKALKELECDRKKTKNINHNRNISLDDVVETAKVRCPRSMAKDLNGTVKEILDACVSVGCTVNGKDPKDLQQEISDGDVEVYLD